MIKESELLILPMYPLSACDELDGLPPISDCLTERRTMAYRRDNRLVLSYVFINYLESKDQDTRLHIDALYGHADIDSTDIKRERIDLSEAPNAESGPRQNLFESRIEALRTLQSDGFDKSKLCEELNTAYTIQCYLPVALQIRAIIDHIPPVFGVE